MNSKRTKRLLYGTLAAIGTTVGAAGIANAATSPSSVTAGSGVTSTVDTPESGETVDKPSYESSITVPQAADESARESSEAALAPLAKVSVEEAKQAALSAVPGTVVSAQLEDENGNVVYGLEVRTASGTVDVKVDAGTGRVLAQDVAEGREASGG